MNTRNSSDRTGARATRVAASSLLALSALSVGVGTTLAAGGSGSIWTTSADCDAPAAQNQNLYASGQTIYVRGANFDASTPFSWSIEGKPGGASGDPGLVVASGSATTDGAGAFCLDLYEVAPDDWGVYSVDVTQGRTSKNDNYRVDGAGDPSEETTDPGDETTDPGDQTTDPGDEATDPGSESDDPAAETTDGTPEAPASTVADESSTSGPASSTTGGTTTPSERVLGAVSTGGSLELPPTDTISAAMTDGSSIFLILGLAGLAAAAVLFAPIRRREPEATE
ncbi:MAG TPA: hypothetical protein VFV53_05565 [Candidatus Limnocylindrales bacterium]|nr:hypothetical protein [Candidatus Limnocylindrales bacterium]